MALDKHVAERRRFAKLLGLADDRGSGLPVGPPGDGDLVTVHGAETNRAP